MKIFLIALTVLLLPLTAFSDDSDTHYDRIHLSVSSSAQLENDTMVATLYAEEEGDRASDLSDIVNKKIHWGLAIIKNSATIKYQTNAYSSNPVYNKNKIKGWRVRQSIRLESKDMALMSDVLGQLQQQLALQSMSFSVSPENKNERDAGLIDDALAAFETRANQVVKKLRRKSYKIVDLNISTSGSRNYRPQYQMKVMAVMADSATMPAVSAGEQTISVTVSGSIELE